MSCILVPTLKMNNKILRIHKKNIYVYCMGIIKFRLLYAENDC